jgi:hypothetical protein
MLLQDTYDRAKVKARVDAFYASMTWIDLADRYPDPDDHVLVKMDDGSIDAGHWDSARAGWSHSPFERWGVPVAWAAIPAEVLTPHAQLTSSR